MVSGIMDGLNFIIFFLNLCVCLCMKHGTCVEVKEQFSQM